MIMIWNRKEVYVGCSMKDFSEVRDVLKVNGINYEYRVVNRNTSSIFGGNRSRMGTFGERQDLAYEYYVYVHKNDYDNAYRIINRK